MSNSISCIEPVASVCGLQSSFRPRIYRINPGIVMIMPSVGIRAHRVLLTGRPTLRPLFRASAPVQAYRAQPELVLDRETPVAWAFGSALCVLFLIVASCVAVWS